MARGPGVRRHRLTCTQCRQEFRSPREDAVTCSDRCRKARQRLLGGPMGEEVTVTRNDDRAKPCRVYLNGRHIGTYPSWDRAELAIAGWLRDWDGEFTIRALSGKRRAKP
jgi:hypothetical protein